MPFQENKNKYSHRAGHRKCLRFLLQNSDMQFRHPFLLTVVFLTTHSDSRLTLDLGLRLMDRLTACQRRRAVTELLDSLVVKDNRGNLQHLLGRLGATCRTQSPYRLGPAGPVFRHNTPMTAIWWKRHECLRLLLRHGAAVDMSQVELNNRLTAESEEEVSLILAWALTIRFVDALLSRADYNVCVIFYWHSIISYIFITELGSEIYKYTFFMPFLHNLAILKLYWF